MLATILKDKKEKQSKKRIGEQLDISQEEFKEAPNELFRENIENIPTVDISEKTTPQKAFNQLVSLYYGLSPYIKTFDKNYELEVKFGTRGLKPLTKNDYDNVIKLLKSFGFSTSNPSGAALLRVNCEFLDSTTGRFKMSDIRTEINGLVAIEKYCRSNDIKSVYKEEPNSIGFIHKKRYMTEDKKILRPVNFNDFNFRVSLQTEQKVRKGIENFILENWRKSKKEFRYLNRVTFTHPEYPVLVDISIVKTGNKGKNKKGFPIIIPVYTLDESNVLNNPETYEIEIEVNNMKVGPGTQFQTPDLIVNAVRKVIKYILSGIQRTMYPIAYPEQNEVLNDYMKMIWDDAYDPKKRIQSKHFIGPNSITLQLTNIAPINENTNVANIRKDFVVTDKADGERHLMYVSDKGKIYFISTNMEVKFTGAKTTNRDCFNLLLDGELITHDKKGEFINLYAAFDIYYHKNTDVRQFPFIKKIGEKNDKSRYNLLEVIRKQLNPVSIMDDTSKKNIENTHFSPIRFKTKQFYPISTKQTIFEGCKNILQKEKEGLFEYEIDGLIFTHSLYGVGSNVVDKAGPKTKITWEYSFKWKPPHYNTIDFLVTTLKTETGKDISKSLFDDGIQTTNVTQYKEYKMIELRCGFSEQRDGFINPCQDIIDDKIPEYKHRFEERNEADYVPKRFYPTEPYDPNAGLCNIMLREDDSGSKQMFTKNNEVFTDNTIVEFAYDLDGEEGWKWVPLRVRYDKTSKLLRGESEFGNSYKVCNENWKSIHPSGRITEDMLSTGLGISEITISEDIYYNTPSGEIKTNALKNFHNLYVKNKIITGASKQGDTLIDFACGKAGDLPKWISARLDFVFGIDYSKDNLENRLDGACARYLSCKKTNKYVPGALFVHGNSAFNIRNGEAMLNDKAKQITNAVFGDGPKSPEQLGKGVAKQYSKGSNGFNVSSCQFAIHYFFENPDMLKGFLRNIAECTKINGYFIGTSYDGKTMFNKLNKLKMDESVQIMDGGKKIWEVVKKYSSDNFEDNSSSIGYQIDVYQESINQYISEYLVNFDYFDRLMESYGFKLINKEEANDMGLPEGSGMFNELFINMLEEIKRNKFREKYYKDAPNMTTYEKNISFINRYFIYKKIREVNIDNLKLELGEYESQVIQREKEDTQEAIEVAQKVIKKNKQTVRKLSKKIQLIPATEALEEETKTVIDETKVINESKLEEIETKKKPQKTQRRQREPKKTLKPKKLLIIEEDDEL